MRLLVPPFAVLLAMSACGSERGSLGDASQDAARVGDALPSPSSSAAAEPPSANSAASPDEAGRPLPPELTAPESASVSELAPSPASEPATTPPALPGPVLVTPVERHGPLRVEGPQLVDASGAPVQLRGVSTMWLNWEGRYSTSREALAWMRDNWRISVVRAAMGVEPEGAYLTDPEAALTQLRQVVQNAIDVGVYVVIDWHDHHADEHREAAFDFFSKVAREYGQLPNVLYEPFNEPENQPWAATIKPYHEGVLRVIRAEDPDNVVILGTRSWSQRADEAALDPVEGVNLMYTVHFYACDHRDYQRRQAMAARDAGLPLFVTEWGATPADGGSANPIVCAADAQLWHDWLDQQRISWTAWKLDGCRDSSCFFASRDAPVAGGWSSEWLHGHAAFIVDKLRSGAVSEP